MAKILCIDDYPMYAELVASMLRQKGHHEVESDIVPLDADRVKAFNPDVIVVNLVRKMESISAGGLTNFYTEVDGAKAFAALSKNGFKDIPIIVTSLAVLEREIPAELNYDAFIEIPQRIDLLLLAIDRIVKNHKKNGDLLPQ